MVVVKKLVVSGLVANDDCKSLAEIASCIAE